MKKIGGISELINILKNRQIISGYLFAISATAIWSGNFIIARGLIENIPPISLAFWRWVVAVTVFLPFALKPLIAERAALRKIFLIWLSPHCLELQYSTH